MTPAWTLTLITAGWLAPGVWGVAGVRSGNRRAAAARARQTEAETALEHAVKAKTAAEGKLAPVEEKLRRTEIALQNAGEDREKQRLATAAEIGRLNQRLFDVQNEASARQWDAKRYHDERDSLRATAYVRQGNRFVRWRPDGVYADPCGQIGTQTGVEATQTGEAVRDKDCTVQDGKAARGSQIEPFRVKMDAEVVADFHEGARLWGIDVHATPDPVPVHAVGDDLGHGRYVGLRRGDGAEMQQGEGA